LFRSEKILEFDAPALPQDVGKLVDTIRNRKAVDIDLMVRDLFGALEHRLKRVEQLEQPHGRKGRGPLDRGCRSTTGEDIATENDPVAELGSSLTVLLVFEQAPDQLRARIDVQ